ncbi:MAG TPA: transporter substrate-binding domain-containing protein [Vicinamibacteria bacterium]
MGYSRWILVAGLGLFALPARADLAEVKASGTLRVLAVKVSPDDEFFAVPVESQPGFDREVIEGFATLHRLRMEPVVVGSWDALIPSLQQGKGDVIVGRFTATDARSKVIAFTAQTFPTRNVVLTRKPHRAVASLAELREEKVGTIRGTSMAEAVAAAGVPKANVVDTVPPGGLPGALRSGQATAVVLGLESAIVAQRDDPEIQIGLFLGQPGSLAYGVRKEDTALLEALNAYIENLRRTPSWNRLVLKYFGDRSLDILKKARE